MGVTNEDLYLPWHEIEPHVEELKQKALKELLEAWRVAQNYHAEKLRWGDEIEYQMITLHDNNKEAHLSLEQDEILDNAKNRNTRFEWQPEFTKYMAESNPLDPYTFRMKDLAGVHQNMTKRRIELQKLLQTDAVPFTLTLFPLLGTPQHRYRGNTEPLDQSANESSRFVPDEVISYQSRYRALETNARKRKGKAMIMHIPIYQDTETESPWVDKDVDTSEGYEDQIMLEGTIFGPGSCGLQVTLSMRGMEEACEIHDQLCVLGPVMLALTASTPIYKGYLAGVDARWNTISQTYDDRNDEEMNKMLPRWSPCPMYLNDTTRMTPDSFCPADSEIQSQLEEAGMTKSLANYYANHLTRSIYLITQEDLNNDGKRREGPSLWTRLSGTIFPHVRLKIPEGDIDGWRLEFRPMEVQFTDFENAACAVFVALFRYAVSKYQLDFRIPIEQVHEDMDKAHNTDACTEQRFQWRQVRISTDGKDRLMTDDEPRSITLDQIMNGNQEESQSSATIGLVEICRRCLDFLDSSDRQGEESSSDRTKVEKYLDFIRDRASGARPTGAHQIRDLVKNHRDYSRDSRITTSMCYDILKNIRSAVEDDLASVQEAEAQVEGRST